MQYVDYQHMIVNEINEIYLVLILFTCIYKYHIFKLFPISYELSYKPIFSKQQCILISDLQITYTVQLTNSFEKSLIYLIYIQRLILIFQISFIFFFIKFHKSICYMYLFIIAIFFFWDCTGINIMHTEYFRDVTYCFYTHIRNITFKMYTIAHSWLCVKHFTRIVLSA